MINTIQLISSCQDKILSLDRMIPVKEYSMRIEEIDELSSNPDIWNDPKRAAALMKERQKLADLLTKLNFFKEQSAFYAEFASLAGNEIDSMQDDISKLHQEMAPFEFNK